MVEQIKLSFTERNPAVQWASVTCSWLVSRFQSFFTSCDAPPASPVHSPAANELSVVIDIPPAGDTGCADPASPPKQPTTTTQRRCFRISIQGFVPDPAHPIVVLIQKQELGKAMLGFSVPMITGLLSDQYRHLSHLHQSLVALALCVGFTATWIGITLRGAWPRVATMMETIGVASIFVAFFGQVAAFLPPSLIWASWMCCGLSCLPFFLCMKPPTARTTVA